MWPFGVFAFVMVLMLVCSSYRNIQAAKEFIERREQTDICSKCGYPYPKDEMMHDPFSSSGQKVCCSCLTGMIALDALIGSVGVEEAENLMSKRIWTVGLLSGSGKVESDGVASQRR